MGSSIEWIQYLADTHNSLPISVNEKEEEFHFVVTTMEQVWKARNEILHGKRISD